MKILFFSPFAAIWPHAMPEALLANGLKEKGHEIIYVSCNELYRDYCISMSAYGLNEHSGYEQKQRVCAKCAVNKKMILDRYRFKQCDVGAVLDEKDIAIAEQLIGAVNPQNFISFIWDGLEIGKYASYEFLIHHKKMDLNLTAVEWEDYKIAFKNTVYTYLGMKKMLAIEKPDRIIIYNSVYSVNRMVKELGESTKIPVYTCYAGDNQSDRYSTLLVVKEHPHKYYPHLKNVLWPLFKETPCSSEMLAYVTDHFEALFSQKDFAAYSPARKGHFDARNYFGIRENQQILVATMSSYDERFASAAIGITPDYKNALFPALLDWIEALIDWVKDKKELFLIIRVHPREFPNRREQRMAPHVEHFKKAMENLPDNIVINWPDDNISIYDLAEETDVFLNAWSNAGNEMSLLGLPVVIYSKELPTYPSDLNYCAEDKNRYFDNIVQALKDGWSFEKIKYTYRWYALMFYRPIVRIRENKLSIINNVIHRMRLHKLFNLDLDVKYVSMADIEKVEELLKETSQCIVDISPSSYSKVAEAQERQYLIREIHRLYKCMYGKSNLISKPTKLQMKFLEVLNVSG